MRAGVLVLVGALLVLVLGLSAPGVRAAVPTLTILSPADHAVIGNGTPVRVIFVVSDFNLTPPGTGGPSPTQGHVAVYVDGVLTMATSQETIELPLASGTYTILLRLVSDNGTSLNPDVRSSISVTVTQGPAVGTPRIQITYVEITFPTPGLVQGRDVTISFSVTDFALVPPGRGTAIPNEGHVDVFLDGVYYMAVTAFRPIPFSDLVDGKHTVQVQLVDVPDPVCAYRRHQPVSPDHANHPGGRDRLRVVLPRLGPRPARDALGPSREEERVRPTKPGAMSPVRARRRSIPPALFAFAILLVVSISSSPVAAVAPSLTIVSPTEGAVIANGTPVLVLFQVSNFAFVQPGRVGQIGSPNEGHANLFLDAQLVRLLTDVEPFSLSLTSGPHTIQIQLVADNGTALNPDVSASVRVVATLGPGGGVPRITILSPTPLESTGHGIYVSYRIENFTLVEPRGQPNAPGEGHVQLLVEGVVVMEVIQYEPVLLVSLPEGDITISARLVNNDNTTLTPDARANVPIHVVASSAVSLPLVSNGGVALLLAFILVVLILRRRKVAARPPNGQGGNP